jgi:hypothetical protein
MIQSGTRPITHSWQLLRDRRGRVSWLRVGTLVVLLMPLAKAVFQANDIAHGARPLNAPDSGRWFFSA